MSLRAAVIGTGPEPDNIVWGESASMAYNHGHAYDELETTELVACSDIVRENAADFAEEFGLPDDAVFDDNVEMLETIEPDIVSIATPVPTHADIVVEVAETGVPAGIHCEKPMAHTWGDAKRMAAACEERDIQLTFNHQRRMGSAWREAKERLDRGEIGELERVEMGGKNLLDYGTHLLDLCNFFNDETDVEWVIGQLDYREEDVRYGTHNENQSLVLWAYENGVRGIASTGFDTGHEAIGCENRIVGSEGRIEVSPEGVDADYRVFSDGSWETYDVENPTLITAAIEHVVDCLRTGEKSEMDAENALRVTRIIFGAWESSRRRGRVDFPLDIDDNPLAAMVESGELRPAPADEE